MRKGYEKGARKVMNNVEIKQNDKIYEDEN